MIALYILELTEEDLCDLWGLLSLLDLQEELDPLEQGILEKIQLLMAELV